MEDEITEALQKIYKNLYFEVDVLKYKDNMFSIDIKMKFLNNYIDDRVGILYEYERFITFEANIQNIEERIDKLIIDRLKEKLYNDFCE